MNLAFDRWMTTALVALCGVACKPGSSSKSDPAIREEPREVLPPLDVGRREEEAALAKMRPEAHLNGTGVLLVGGSRSCLVTRVGESFLLTAASCVMEPKTGFPRPAYLFDVNLAVGYRSPEGQDSTQDFVVRAVHAHPSFLSYFKERQLQNDPEIWSDVETLSTVADLALLQVQWIGNEPQAWPVAVVAKTWPESTPKEVWLLQGSCLSSNSKDDEKKEPPFIEGGRILDMSKESGVARFYVTDDYPHSRAIFDCEGFRGAPVMIPNGKEIIGVASWAHPGSKLRGFTPLASAEKSKEGTPQEWMESVLKSPPPVTWPELDSQVTCSRVVETAIGNFNVQLESWELLRTGAEFGMSFPTQKIKLDVSAPSDSVKQDGVIPLVAVGGQSQSKIFEMMRDIRQPAFVQYVSRDTLELGEESLNLTLISTDRKTALVVVSLNSKKAGKERTINVYFGDIFQGDYCKLSGIGKAATEVADPPSSK